MSSEYEEDDFYEENEYSSQPEDEEDSGSEDACDSELCHTEGSLAVLARLLADTPEQLGDFSFGGVADFLPHTPGL